MNSEDDEVDKVAGAPSTSRSMTARRQYPREDGKYELPKQKEPPDSSVARGNWYLLQTWGWRAL